MAQVSPEAVITARRRFFDGTAVAPDLVAAPILRSWQRCAELGLEGRARPRIEPLTAREFDVARERSEALRRLCRPEIEALLSDATATDSLVILTDPDGLILDSVGSTEFAGRAARVALRAGVPWSEAATGTNAVGMALVERRPVEVRGPEHFFEPHGILTCSAAPIVGPRGDLVGVLDISGHARVPHMHALGLVRLAVDQIEHRLFEAGFERCEIVRCAGDPALLGTPREGVLVFDDGRLVAANRYGLGLVGLDWQALDRQLYGDIFRSALADGGRLQACGGAALYGRVQRPTPARAAPAGGLSRAAEPMFDAATEAALARAVRLADADVPVLVTGETGTGKEVFVRAVHQASRRAGRPFVAVNCAALPEGLIEAELFGYEEGAFTGARRRGSKGLMREADGGVLFLDEIGDMPLALQARLLRVLQEREVVPLGGGRPTPVDFALMAATHCDLKALVDAGRFRADLYFRIAQYTVALEPLRLRPDRAALIAALWRQLAGPVGATLSPACLDRLAGYDWPGNFRQLVGLLRALVALAEPGRPLSVDALPLEIRVVDRAPSVPREEVGSLDAITLEAMREALAAAGGNVSRAARRLGVSRSTLYRRVLADARDGRRPA